jgi:hypothetical protein
MTEIVHASLHRVVVLSCRCCCCCCFRSVLQSLITTTPLLSLSVDDQSLLPVAQDSNGKPSNAEGDNGIQQADDGEEAAADDEEEKANMAQFHRLVTTTSHVLKDVLEVRYITHQQEDEPTNAYFTFAKLGDASNYDCEVVVRPRHLTIVCRSPLRVPTNQRIRVAEFVTRANYSLVLGHFDLDFLDGELLFRVLQDNVTGLADAPSRTAGYIGLAVAVMDEHLPPIMKLMYGGMTPEQAVQSLYSDCRADQAFEQ